jgi:hypothetical protein
VGVYLGHISYQVAIQHKKTGSHLSLIDLPLAENIAVGCLNPSLEPLNTILSSLRRSVV